MGLAVAVMGTLAVGAATSSASLGLYNPAWDGASEFSASASAAAVDERLLRNSERYDGVAADGTIAVILSPDSPYSAGDVRRIDRFVHEGGTLLVAADFRESGPELLAALGANASITGLALRDEERYGPSPAFPLAPNVSAHPYTGGVESLVLNHPSTIDANGATVLVESSSFGYLDVNRNQELDEAETLTSHPVVTIEPAGNGEIVGVSDPSIFINAMLERGDNRQFLTNLVESHERVVIDVSHTSALPPLIRVRLLLWELPILQMLLGTVLLVAVGAAGRRWDGITSVTIPVIGRLRPGGRDPPDGPELSAAAVATAVRERHPDWNEERIARVTQGIIRGEREGRDDD